MYLERPGPIDRTPETPGSGKKQEEKSDQAIQRNSFQQTQHVWKFEIIFISDT